MYSWYTYHTQKQSQIRELAKISMKVAVLVISAILTLQVPVSKERPVPILETYSLGTRAFYSMWMEVQVLLQHCLQRALQDIRKS